MQRLRIGIVGLGGAGRAHARRFAQDPRAEVVGFFDPKPRHLEEAQQELRLDSVKILEQDWPAFLGKCRADIMALCSPDHVHVEHALDSLNAGCHVLCEKPMATTVEDAVSMAETAQRVGRKLMIHHQMRYLPVFLAAKKKMNGWPGTRSPKSSPIAVIRLFRRILTSIPFFRC